MKWLLALLGILLGATALIFGLEIGGLHGQLNQAHAQLTSQARELSRDEAQLAQVQSQMASLTKPTDPLSAYSAVCSFLGNDGTTTWYYPCTNQAQTIPQPSQ